MLGYFSSTDIIGRERDIALSRLESRNLGKEWFQVLLAYEIGESLGTGSYGKVYKCHSRSSGKTVAIKHISGFSKSDYDCVKLLREITILNNIQNEFFPVLYDTIIPKGVPDHIFLVTEFVETDLRTIILTKKLSFQNVKVLLYNLL